MRKIGEVVRRIYDDEARFIKVNWIIVSTSHDIYKRRGTIGHLKRQHIRKRLWREAQERYPVLRKYIIPREISGDNRCHIKRVYAPKISWAAKIISRIKEVFRKIITFFHNLF
jgi:hypothetical protein